MLGYGTFLESHAIPQQDFNMLTSVILQKSATGLIHCVTGYLIPVVLRARCVWSSKQMPCVPGDIHCERRWSVKGKVNSYKPSWPSGKRTAHAQLQGNLPPMQPPWVVRGLLKSNHYRYCDRHRNSEIFVLMMEASPNPKQFRNDRSRVFLGKT